jgi:hypothetical protein
MGSSSTVKVKFAKKFLVSELLGRMQECLPAGALKALGQLLPYVLPCYNCFNTITILRGPSRFSEEFATVIIAGAEARVGYLAYRFFKERPYRELIGKVPIWELCPTLKRLRTCSDLTIARVDRLSAKLFFDHDYFVVPEWVDAWLTVPNDPMDLIHASHSVAEDMRLIRSNGLISSVSHSWADFELFYRTMYVPFIHMRHGDQAILRNMHQMRRSFQKGGLLWAVRGGQRITGAVFEQCGQLLHFLAEGTANGEWAPVKAGGIAALYYYAVEYAHQARCKRINFGGCRPTLNDGVLRYKRKWGMQLAAKPDNRYDFLVYWPRLNEPVASFLASTPLVFLDQNGLSVLTMIENGTPVSASHARMMVRSLWTPGLRQLYVVASPAWRERVHELPRTCFIELSTDEDSTPLGLFRRKRMN